MAPFLLTIAIYNESGKRIYVSLRCCFTILINIETIGRYSLAEKFCYLLNDRSHTLAMRAPSCVELYKHYRC